MRAILVGSARERERLRGQLDRSSVTVVGEHATMADARRAGVDADAFVLPAAADGGDVRPPVEAMTPRELDVLTLLVEGHSNKAIASRLGISDQTVKFHVASIIGKLGASNRTDAVRRALRRGLVTV